MTLQALYEEIGRSIAAGNGHKTVCLAEDECDGVWRPRRVYCYDDPALIADYNWTTEDNLNDLVVLGC